MKKLCMSFLSENFSGFTFFSKLKQVLKEPENLTDEQFRIINTYVLSIICIFFLVINIFVNRDNPNPEVFFVISLVIAIKCSSILCLYYRILPVTVVQPISIGVLAMLGYFILMTSSYDATGSLVWFIIFPPMIMFVMKLYSGTVVFLLYFLSLCLLILSPLNFLVSDNFTEPQLFRFLLAFCGSFIFSFSTEYLRYRTKAALVKAYRKHEEYAITDPLTGLKNRRGFDKILPKVLSQAEKDSVHYTVMLADIDHFKSINDTYGHDVGDAVLQHISQILLSQKSPQDYVFRWGGEEFILLMSHVSHEQASSIANRIRLACKSSPYIVEKQNPDNPNDLVARELSVTMSIGYHVAPYYVCPWQTIKHADNNVYKSKANGRDCVFGNGEK